MVRLLNACNSATCLTCRSFSLKRSESPSITTPDWLHSLKLTLTVFANNIEITRIFCKFFLFYKMLPNLTSYHDLFSLRSWIELLHESPTLFAYVSSVKRNFLFVSIEENSWIGQRKLNSHGRIFSVMSKYAYHQCFSVWRPMLLISVIYRLRDYSGTRY